VRFGDSDVPKRITKAKTHRVSQLPNPKISLTALNLRTEQPFDFDAEPLTQGVIGISQRFPRGDTLNIQRLREERQGDSRLLDIQIRRDQLRKSVRREWVNVFEAQQRRTLLHGLHEVYAELMPIVTAQYEVGAGGQEDILALRLKQALLTDRITEQDSKLQQHRHRLREWIGDAASRAWPATLPEHLQRIPSGDVRQHPEIQRLTLQSRSQRHQVNLARQAYEPEYDLNARYGLRVMVCAMGAAMCSASALILICHCFPPKRRMPNWRASNICTRPA
jgi:outer membrane protein TolC